MRKGGISRREISHGLCPKRLDGWGESAEGVSRGMTPDDALPSQGRSIAIETSSEPTLWDTTCGIEHPETDWLIEQDYLMKSDRMVAAAVELEAFYRLRDALRAAPADSRDDTPLTITTRTAVVLARLLLRKLT